MVKNKISQKKFRGTLRPQLLFDFAAWPIITWPTSGLSLPVEWVYPPLLQTHLTFFFFIYHEDYSVVKGQNPIVDIAEGGNMGFLPPSVQSSGCPNSEM